LSQIKILGLQQQVTRMGYNMMLDQPLSYINISIWILSLAGVFSKLIYVGEMSVWASAFSYFFKHIICFKCVLKSVVKLFYLGDLLSQFLIRKLVCFMQGFWFLLG